jgi:hypothetical protein
MFSLVSFVDWAAHAGGLVQGVLLGLSLLSGEFRHVGLRVIINLCRSSSSPPPSVLDDLPTAARERCALRLLPGLFIHSRLSFRRSHEPIRRHQWREPRHLHCDRMDRMVTAASSRAKA